MKLRVIKAELLRHFECPYCLQPLNKDNIELTATGLIECHNTTGDCFVSEFGAPCLRKFTLTYCGGCRKVGLTKNMQFHTRKLVGSRAEVRCHVCQNGKLSSMLERAIPHIKQVFIDSDGKILIKPPEGHGDVMVIDELTKIWGKDYQFTPEMIGKGEVDRSNLRVIPKSFWKSGTPHMGYDEPLSEALCERCGVTLMTLPDITKIENYSHVCPKCGVYFRVITAGELE